MKPTKNDVERRLEEVEERSSDDTDDGPLMVLKETIVDKDGEVQETEVTEFL